MYIFKIKIKKKMLYPIFFHITKLLIYIYIKSKSLTFCWPLQNLPYLYYFIIFFSLIFFSYNFYIDKNINLITIQILLQFIFSYPIKFYFFFWINNKTKAATAHHYNLFFFIFKICIVLGWYVYNTYGKLF